MEDYSNMPNSYGPRGALRDDRLNEALQAQAEAIARLPSQTRCTALEYAFQLSAYETDKPVTAKTIVADAAEFERYLLDGNLNPND